MGAMMMMMMSGVRVRMGGVKMMGRGVKRMRMGEESDEVQSCDGMWTACKCVSLRTRLACHHVLTCACGLCCCGLGWQGWDWGGGVEL